MSPINYKMRHISLVILSFGMLALVGISSCGEDGGATGNDFDQQPLLDNLANNLIIPAYEDFSEVSSQLVTTIDALNDDLSFENLETARTQLNATRLAWQACAFYQFGPAETNGLAALTNLFPVDINQIDRNIETGEYNLAQVSNADARGLPAIEYLLYGNGQADNEILQSMVVGNKLPYLLDVANLIATTAISTLSDWNSSSGDYVATFTSEQALGVSAGSSIAQLLNGVIQYYERNIRDGKVGIPVGIRSLGEIIPENVEAYYAQNSLALLRESIIQLRGMYTGGTGVGFDDYLISLQAVSTNNEDLAAAIDDQFVQILAAIDQVNAPLSEAIINNKVAVEQIFAEMQGLATLMKTDMSSQIGVGITFQDSDGD